VPTPTAPASKVDHELAIGQIGRALRVALYVAFLLGALVFVCLNLTGMDAAPLNLVAVVVGALGTILVMVADVTAGLNLYSGEAPKVYPRVSGWTRVIGTAALLAAAVYAIFAAINAL
jgi:hypothetical protein